MHPWPGSTAPPGIKTFPILLRDGNRNGHHSDKVEPKWCLRWAILENSSSLAKRGHFSFLWNGSTSRRGAKMVPRRGLFCGQQNGPSEEPFWLLFFFWVIALLYTRLFVIQKWFTMSREIPINRALGNIRNKGRIQATSNLYLFLGLWNKLVSNGKY